MSDRQASSVLPHSLRHFLGIFLVDDLPESWVIEHFVLHAAVHEQVVASLSGYLGRLLLDSPDFVVEISTLVIQLLDFLI